MRKSLTMLLTAALAIALSVAFAGPSHASSISMNGVSGGATITHSGITTPRVIICATSSSACDLNAQHYVIEGPAAASPVNVLVGVAVTSVNPSASTTLPLGNYRIELATASLPNVRVGPAASASVTSTNGSATVTFANLSSGKIYICPSGTSSPLCKIPGSALYSVPMTSSPLSITQGMSVLDANGNAVTLPAGSFKIATFDGSTFVSATDNISIATPASPSAGTGSSETGTSTSGTTSNGGGTSTGATETALLPNPATVTPKFGKRTKAKGKSKFVLLKKAVPVASGVKAKAVVTFSNKKGVSKKLGKAKVKKKSGKITVKLRSKKPMTITLVLSAPATAKYQPFALTKTWVLK